MAALIEVRDVTEEKAARATDLGRAHLSGLGYEIPPPRRTDNGMPSLWDEPLAAEA